MIALPATSGHPWIDGVVTFGAAMFLFWLRENPVIPCGVHFSGAGKMAFLVREKATFPAEVCRIATVVAVISWLTIGELLGCSAILSVVTNHLIELTPR